MRYVVLDFETYFDKEYSLNKLSTEHYIRNPLFEAHGAAIKWQPDIPARWYDARALKAVLAEEDWSDVFLIAHHMQFDGLILSYHYGIIPAMYGCTLSMSRLLLGNHISVSLDSVKTIFGLPAKTTPYKDFIGKHWHELEQDVKNNIADGACDETESVWIIFNRIMKGDY